MPAIANTNIVELTMFGEYQSQAILNVFHYQYNGAGIEEADYTDNMAAVGTKFVAGPWKNAVSGIKNFVVSDYLLRKVRCQLIYPTRGYYVDTAVVENGSVAPPGCPANVGITLAYATNRAKRGVTGSKRFTALPLAGLNGGLWSNGTVANWTTVTNSLDDALTGVNILDVFFPTVWSPKRPNDRATLLRITPNAQVRTQHRRSVGLGI